MFTGGEVPEQMPGNEALKELAEAVGVAREGGVEVLTDLADEGGAALLSEHWNIKLNKQTTYVFAGSESAK